MVKRNEIIETIIEDVNFPNIGISKLGGKKLIIKNVLVGQKVKARVKKKRKDKIEARLLEVIEKSPLETEHGCIHKDVCGGCSYQTLPYNEQLKLKESQVKKLLDEAGIDGYEFLGIESSPSEIEYRNKMEFTFGDEEKGGKLALGMHQKGKFYEIAIVENCRIVDEDFTNILKLVLKYFSEKNVPFYHKKSHEGILRHLVVRKAVKTGEILVNLVTSSQGELDLSELSNLLKKMKLKGKMAGFLHTINDSIADIVRSDVTKIILGRDYIIEEILGLKFKISAFSFFQTNTLGAEKLYSIVRNFAGDIKDKVIFDLYCGTGTIAQVMAPVAEKVIGIEIVEEAVEAAKENAVLNNLNNCKFIAGDVLEKVDELENKPDLIILDPPRSGVHNKAINKIINFNAPQIIYVSCKPTSLVEDLKIFTENGYKVEKVKCMDMFPFTVHVETVVQLCRQNP